MFIHLQDNVIMSFDDEALKTNEFLRRRKLRLQQVREQSKDIAKKIRQKTRNETSRYLKHLDAKKRKEHFLDQEKVVKHLENLYINQMKQVGSSHRSASHVNQTEQPTEKLDLSKERGKVAAAHLRQKKQQELDRKKLLLDRKLLARQAANELCRDKSSVITNKPQEKIVTTKQSVETQLEKDNEKTPNKGQPSVQFDNATSKEQVLDIKETLQKDKDVQWNLQNLPRELEPNVPELKLHKTDKEESVDTNLITSQTTTGGTKKSNLFAVSEEMPSSLRGGLVHRTSKPPVSTKSSLTLVSEYLQTRHMRLREHPVIPSKPIGNLDSIRETLMHARAVRSKAKPTEQNKTDGSSSSVARNSVTIYNHTTRDIKDVPLGPEKFVTRESQHDEDAYSQALKESSNSEKQGIHLKKTQTTRSRVAMAKQDVEKEYKDTIAFLNSLPKDKQIKALKKAYMDEYQQNAQRENHQRKMQQEFKKIEKQCKKQAVMKAGRRKVTKTTDENVKIDENDLNVADCMKEQYSWIPSPENDVSFAVHKIPNKAENLQNLCKQNDANGYHEYRSRHKHTPPTKDMAGEKTKKQPKTLIEEQIKHQTDESSSTDDDDSSFDKSQIKQSKKKLKKQVSASTREKIIIYKILSNQNENKGDEPNSDSVNDILKSITSIDRVLQNSGDDENGVVNKTKTRKKTELSQSKAHEIDEALYKKANPQWENGNSMQYDGKAENLADEKICKQCQYRKHNNVAIKEKPVNKGPIQWQVDDNNSSGQMSSRSCDECKRMNNATSNLSTNVEKPSEVMSSLRSKTSKIVKNIHAHSEAELIKLMENDDEKNKFYVGASGVLKNEDYEVIIQLRKKNQKESEKHGVCQNIDTNVKYKDNIEELNTIPIISKKTTKDHSNACPSKLFETEAQLNKDLPDQKLESQYFKPQMITINTEKLPDVNGNHQYTLANETGVSVPDIPQVALDLPKTNDLVTQATNTSHPRPVVTVCTQTSGRNSPESRSMFVQMSSSTSTTYLSPPERVLPGYLRSRCTEPTNHIEIIPQMSYREKKCKHKIINQEKKYVKHNPISRKIETAINIASANLGHIYNTKKINQMYYSGSPDNEIKKKIRGKTTQSESELSKKEKIKHRYHRPAHDGVSEESCKTCLEPGKFKNKSVRNGTSEKCTCNTMVPLSSCKVSLRHMEKSPTVRQQLKNKSQLNPVLKNYVRELLNLNREGLKAIEIAALQCSSMTTPCSSIINEPSNKPINKKSNSDNILLTKLEKILSQEKIRNVSKKHENKPSSISSENNIEKSSKVFVRRQLKKKHSGQMMGHKIKNLNISKTVLGSKRNFRNERKKQNSLPFDDSSDNNIMKRVTKDTKNSQPKTHRPKVRSISSPSPRTTVYPFKLQKTKTTSNILQNESKNFTSGETNSFESHSEKKSSKRSVICNNTAKIDNITVTTAPDKITITLKPPIEVKSMTKQIKAVVNNKLIQIPSKGEITSKNKELDNSAVSATQTNWDKIQELELMKFAQNKLHNMEKIANLTDKCTKRLSNLARVLEEVRKSKSTAYSHISTTDTSSEIEIKIDENIHSDKSKKDLYFHKNDGAIEAKKQLLSAPSESNNEKTNYTESDLHKTNKPDYSNQITRNIEEISAEHFFRTEMDRTKLMKFREQSLTSVATNTESIDNIPLFTENIRLPSNKESQLVTSTAMNTEQIDIPVHTSIENNESDISIATNIKQLDNNNYVPMLSDIPRPLNAPSSSFLHKEITIHDVYSIVKPENCSRKLDLYHVDGTGRSRSKPPPALSRVTLKTSDEILVPHELSTVIEVDSPMSMKYKKQSPTQVNDSKLSHSEMMNDEILLESDNEKKLEEQNQTDADLLLKPDVIEKKLISELMKDSSQLKMKVLDLNEFNEIMLKPFMTMEEYAKQCNVGQLDEGSNHEDLSRAATIDEISSLNSDASMPDIVAELLKRNVISEPFHFDFASNPNSTTLSSESSLPIFALSKVPKEKSKSKTAHKSKERAKASETSDSLSMSSYPDLENAFKNFGIGWASSTLKRTKQTLYLSSSTSTSSISNKYTPKKCDDIVQVLPKNADNKKNNDNKEIDKNRQNTGQQTSKAKSMTVNEFLINESSEKMSSSHKLSRDESEEHFTSLYSTKLPSETNLQVSYPPSEKHSEENVRTNTRQRTSTPVQLYKSETYNSSSSSNNRSDGLFSNTDELSSVKMTSSSVKNHSSSEKDGLTIPNYSLRVRKENTSDCS